MYIHIYYICAHIAFINAVLAIAVIFSACACCQSNAFHPLRECICMYVYAILISDAISVSNSCITIVDISTYIHTYSLCITHWWVHMALSINVIFGVVSFINGAKWILFCLFFPLTSVGEQIDSFHSSPFLFSLIRWSCVNTCGTFV